VVYLEDLGSEFRVKSVGQPTARLRNTWEPRVAVEYRLLADLLALRAGYAYRPSPLEADQEHGNMLLDNSWHTVSCGAGVRLFRQGETGETRLNLHFQGLILQPRYQLVGYPAVEKQPAAKGVFHTEGFMAGFGIELLSNF